MLGKARAAPLGARRHRHAIPWATKGQPPQLHVQLRLIEVRLQLSRVIDASIRPSNFPSCTTFPLFAVVRPMICPCQLT